MDKRITGLPVVDSNGLVVRHIKAVYTFGNCLVKDSKQSFVLLQVGVVSDFDLLALDSLGRTNDAPLFPTADETWQVGSNLAGNKQAETLYKALLYA